MTKNELGSFFYLSTHIYGTGEIQSMVITRLIIFLDLYPQVSERLADYPALSVDRAGGGNPLYAGDTPIQEFLIWCAPIQEFLNRCAPIQEFLI